VKNGTSRERRPIRNVTVFCASSNSIHAEYFEAAHALGQALAESGRMLVYGGGDLGLMGAIAAEMQSHSGRVHGIITKKLARLEQARHACDELEIVETMRDRKRRMEELADAFIALPGGIGTFEELIEIIVGRLLGEHHCPIVIVDVAGYFRPLIALFDHAINEGFMQESIREMFDVVDTPKEAMVILDEFGNA